MKKIILTLLLGIILATTGKAQPTITITSVFGATPGTNVTVYLIGNNLVNYSSLSIQILYDCSVLQYVETQPVMTAVASGFTTTNVIPAVPPANLCTLVLAWFSLTPFTAMGDTLFAFTFTYIGGFTNLTIPPIPGWVINNGSVSSLGVGLPAVASFEKNIEVYPNPSASGQLDISCLYLNGEYVLEIFSAGGNLVKSHKFEFSGGRDILSTPSYYLQPGVYILKMTGENKVFTRKIIIQ